MIRSQHDRALGEENKNLNSALIKTVLWAILLCCKDGAGKQTREQQSSVLQPHTGNLRANLQDLRGPVWDVRCTARPLHAVTSDLQGRASISRREPFWVCVSAIVYTVWWVQVAPLQTYHLGRQGPVEQVTLSNLSYKKMPSVINIIPISTSTQPKLKLLLLHSWIQLSSSVVVVVVVVVEPLLANKLRRVRTPWRHYGAHTPSCFVSE